MKPSLVARRSTCRNERAEKIHGRGPDGKTIVAAVLDRGGEIRAKVCKTRRKPELQEMVRDSVESGSSVYSDALKSYNGLDELKHQVIDHAEAYVNGQVHTNDCRTYGVCLSAVFTARTSLSRFICSATLTSRRSAITTGRGCCGQIRCRRLADRWEAADLQGTDGQERRAGVLIVRRSGLALAFWSAPVWIGIHLLAVRFLPSHDERLWHGQ